MATIAEAKRSNDLVEQLVEAAEQFWDDNEWAISQTAWTDGDLDAYAYKSLGRDDRGRIREERLSVVDGEIRAERTLTEKRLIESTDLGVVAD